MIAHQFYDDDNNKSNTRLSRTLQYTSQDRIKEVLTAGARWADSTMKKMEWVQKIYEAFCNVIGVTNPWLLQAEPVAGFIRFCAIDCNYNIYSVKNVMAPSLKRIHSQNSSKKISNNNNKNKSVKHPPQLQ